MRTRLPRATRLIRREDEAAISHLCHRLCCAAGRVHVQSHENDGRFKGGIEFTTFVFDADGNC